MNNKTITVIEKRNAFILSFNDFKVKLFKEDTKYKIPKRFDFALPHEFNNFGEWMESDESFKLINHLDNNFEGTSIQLLNNDIVQLWNEFEKLKS